MFKFKTQDFAKKIVVTLRNFWLPGILSFCAGILFVTDVKSLQPETKIELVMTLILLTILSLGLSWLLTNRSNKISVYLCQVPVLLAVGSGIFANFYYQYNPDSEFKLMFTFFGIILISLFLPFAFNSKNEDLLRLIKRLVINTIIAGIMTGIFITFVSVFLSMFNFSFSVYIPYWVMRDMPTVAVSTFGFWIFAFLLPNDFSVQEEDTYIDKLFNFLTNVILLPFTFLYVVMIYLYSAKILIFWQWPANQIAFYLAVLFLLLVFAYILKYTPITDTATKIKTYLRGTLFVCLPLWLVYFMAVIMRIHQYGYTVDRLSAVLFGIVGLFVSVYLAFDRNVKIKLIPVVVGSILLLTTFGPWSFYNIELHSQTYLYRQFLLENNLLVANNVVIPTYFVNHGPEARQATIMTQFMIRRYGPEIILPYFPNIKVEIVNGKISKSALSREVEHFFID